MLRVRIGYQSVSLSTRCGWRVWCCEDGLRGCYAFTPWGAWRRLNRWYAADPRKHYPGCDGNHHRATLCPQYFDQRP